MGDNATITVSANYLTATPNIPPSPAQVTDSIDTSITSSLSGSGDSSGALTDKTVPNTNGGSDNTKKHRALPDGVIYIGTTVKITITCPGNGAIKTLEGTGSITASGSVLPGNCITITTVNEEWIEHKSIREIITSTEKICC